MPEEIEEYDGIEFDSNDNFVPLETITGISPTKDLENAKGYFALSKKHKSYAEEFKQKVLSYR